jgi:hypothetical protein
MRAILVALTHIAQRTGRFSVAEATELYNKLWVYLGYVLLACVLAFWLNAGFGWKAPSLFLAIAFAITAIYLWAKPLHLLAVTGVGLAKKVAGDESLASEVEGVLKTYLNHVLKWVLLGVITFLLITGTVPFSEYPMAAPTILVALGVYGLFVWAWPKVFTGTLGRRIVYGFAVAVMVGSFAWLIPGSYWVKYMPGGWDPKTELATTRTEDTLYAIREAQAERQQATEDEVLQRILRKVRRGEALAPEEEGFLRNKEAMSAKADSKKPEKLLTVSMPPYGDSEPVPAVPGVVFYGSGFEPHAVYVGGRDCVVGKEVCEDGDILYFYLRDTSGRPNQARYEIRKSS